MDGKWQVSVAYLTPAELAGMVVSAVCDDGGVPIGEIEILRTGESFLSEAQAFAGLLRPATIWLLQAEIQTVQKLGGEYLLSFVSGELMRLREDGLPILVSGEDFSMEMVWMERGK